MILKIKEKDESPLTIRKPRPQHWHTFASGVSGIGVHAVVNARENRLVAELYIVDDKSIFDSLEKDKDSIEKDFGEKFIKLSRDVHFLNDDRAKIKLEINNHTGSVIKEIKEYTSY